MKRLLLALAAVICWSSPLWADLGTGADAYERGDYATALAEWKPLAEDGNALAQFNLALLYHYGLGVERDMELALEWYEKAAQQNQPDAQVAIGDLFKDGLWGAHDLEEAAAWYGLAAKQGHAEAKKKLDDVRSEMRPNTPKAPKAPSPETPSPDPQSAIESSERDAPRQVALSGTCPVEAADPFDIDVRIEIPQAPIIRDHSSAELSRATFHGAGSRVLGLMVPNFDIKTQGRYGIRPYGDDHCFWVAGISVELFYRSIDIYVAKEYKTNSCNYHAVLLHEQEHVNVARENLQRFAPRVRGALTSLNIPQAEAPIMVASPEAAEAEMRRLFAKILEPEYQKMMAALQEAQAKVDAPHEYRRVHRLCKNW
jgi:TPR repeat protein